MARSPAPTLSLSASVYEDLREAFPDASWTFPKLPDMLLYATDIRRFGMLDALTTAIREFTNKWCASALRAAGRGRESRLRLDAISAACENERRSLSSFLCPLFPQPLC